jgi:hypothetical protein
LAAAVGAVIAFVLIPVTPAGTPIIAASAACLLGWVEAAVSTVGSSVVVAQRRSR